MSETTGLQDAFVAAYVANGGNATQAAREAGYSEDSARQIGGRLLEKPHVQEAIRDEQFRVLRGPLASRALEVLRAALEPDSGAPWGVKVDAAKTVLDRASIIAANAQPLRDERPPVDIDALQAFIEAGSAALARRKAMRAALVGDAPSESLH